MYDTQPTKMAKNATYVRNSSDETYRRYMWALAQSRLEEVHRQRPAEVQQRDHGEDDPGADDGSAGPARLLSRVAVTDERASGAGLLFEIGRASCRGRGE